MQLKPGTFLQGGKYRIIRTLGSGGFGITYLAEHTMAEHEVCIKEFFPSQFYNRDDNACTAHIGSKGSVEMMEGYKKKFIKEAKTIARLNHPNIIHIHDVFAENNTAYYVMEYIKGDSLDDIVKSRGALPEAEAVEYIRKVAKAVEYIHERKIMHLDIKPANIMLRREDKCPILIDFGLSKNYDEKSGSSSTSTLGGVSLGYSPIEQYEHNGINCFSPETDIYALGATLYYLVTGKTPPSAGEVSSHGLPAFPAHISFSVRRAITAAMQSSREARPHSIREFISHFNTTGSRPKTKKRWWLWLLLAIVALFILGIIFLGPDEHSVPTPPNDEIWYTSTDGEIVEPDEDSIFGAEIVSNTYKSGKGIIKFDGDITTIGEDAFSDCEELKSINLPSSIITIEECAFDSCVNLSEAVLHNGIISIGDEAFWDCDGLTTITLPNTLNSIGEAAFEDCGNLINLSIPDSVTTIGDYAFCACLNLTNVNIPNSLTTLSEGMFSECTSLEKITIPNSVTVIRCGAFEYCTNLKEITIPNSVAVIENEVFYSCENLKRFKGKYAKDNGRCLIYNNSIIAYAAASGTTYTIPDGVESIGDYAFSSCEDLTEITIPESVSVIGNYAFAWCSSLTDVTIPYGVTTIGNSAFVMCENLANVNIPNSVESLGQDAFYKCFALTSVTIPNSVASIGQGVFANCPNIKQFKGHFATEDGRALIVDDTLVAYANSSGSEYTIPYNVTTIFGEAFGGSNKLTKIVIPYSVVKINNLAFYGCGNLYMAVIGQNVQEIGESAFRCSNLQYISCLASYPPKMGENVFSTDIKDRTIYVPIELEYAYKQANGWSAYADDIVGYDFFVNTTEE